MNLEEAHQSLRCHAALLDDKGLPLKTCSHDHSYYIQEAMSCALKTGWNGAIEFKVNGRTRLRTLKRWHVFITNRAERHFKAL